MIRFLLESIKALSPSEPIHNPIKNGSKWTLLMKMMTTFKQKNKSKTCWSAFKEHLKSLKSPKKALTPPLSSKKFNKKAKIAKVLTKNKVKQTSPYRDASKKSFSTNLINLSYKKVNHKQKKNAAKKQTKPWNWYLNLKKAEILIKKFNHQKQIKTVQTLKLRISDQSSSKYQ